jgi:hypothetical protein
MRWFRGVCFAGLFACIAPLPLVLAQTSGGDLLSGPVAPSDGVIQSSSASKKSHLRSAYSGAPNNIGSVLASGGIPGESSSLCFQPGIGWKPAPLAALRSAAGSSANSPPGSPRVVGAQPLGTSKGISDGCVSSPAFGASIETLMAGKAVAAPTANINLGAEDWLKADSALNPAGSVAFSRLKMGLSPTPYSAVSFSRNVGSDDSLEAAQELGTHAYISTIKLRKMIRNAPDLATRIKLQELSDKLTGKPVKPLDSYEENKARNKEKLQREPGTSLSPQMNGGKTNNRRHTSP